MLTFHVNCLTMCRHENSLNYFHLQFWICKFGIQIRCRFRLQRFESLIVWIVAWEFGSLGVSKFYDTLLGQESLEGCSQCHNVFFVIYYVQRLEEMGILRYITTSGSSDRGQKKKKTEKGQESLKPMKRLQNTWLHDIDVP